MFPYKPYDVSFSSYTIPSGSAVNFELDLFPHSINFLLSEYTIPSGSAVNFEFGIVSISEFLIALGVRKKLGRPEWDDPLGVYGIWQMRNTLTGKRPVKMKFYTPTNPQTTAQQANRQKFANAMAAWGNLTQAEKDEYNERAKGRGLFGWNLFIRQYYQDN